RTSSTAGGMLSVTVTLPVGVSAGLVTRIVQVTVSPMVAISGETILVSAGCPATGAEAGAAGPPPGSPGTAVGCTCVGSGVTVGVTPCATTVLMSLSETGAKLRPDGSLYSTVTTSSSCVPSASPGSTAAVSVTVAVLAPVPAPGRKIGAGKP